jgi:hypothetical protein
MTVK